MTEKVEAALTIGALARAAGVHVETIRYYQRRGLLQAPHKPYGSIRRYDQAALARLHFIRAAQWLGFTLNEVAGLLRLEDGAHCDEARELGERKLVDVRDRIQGLQRIERVLVERVQACAAQPNSVQCPLISALYDEAL